MKTRHIEALKTFGLYATAGILGLCVTEGMVMITNKNVFGGNRKPLFPDMHKKADEIDSSELSAMVYRDLGRETNLVQAKRYQEEALAIRKRI